MTVSGKDQKVKMMTVTAMLAAVSIVLYYVAEIPIIPFIPHLKMDLSDIPALIAGITLSPIAAVFVELIKNAIHLLRTGTFGIGELANFVVGVALTVTFTVCYKKTSCKMSKTKAILLTSILSYAAIVISGLLINAIVYPIYMKLIGAVIESPQAMIAYLWGTIIMNTVKAIITIACVVPLIYKLQMFRPSEKIS